MKIFASVSCQTRKIQIFPYTSPESEISINNRMLKDHEYSLRVKISDDDASLSIKDVIVVMRMRICGVGKTASETCPLYQLFSPQYQYEGILLIVMEYLSGQEIVSMASLSKHVQRVCKLAPLDFAGQPIEISETFGGMKKMVEQYTFKELVLSCKDRTTWKCRNFVWKRFRTSVSSTYATSFCRELAKSVNVRYLETLECLNFGHLRISYSGVLTLLDDFQGIRTLGFDFEIVPDGILPAQLEKKSKLRCLRVDIGANKVFFSHVRSKCPALQMFQFSRSKTAPWLRRDPETNKQTSLCLFPFSSSSTKDSRSSRPSKESFSKWRKYEFNFGCRRSGHVALDSRRDKFSHDAWYYFIDALGIEWAVVLSDRDLVTKHGAEGFKFCVYNVSPYVVEYKYGVVIPSLNISTRYGVKYASIPGQGRLSQDIYTKRYDFDKLSLKVILWMRVYQIYRDEKEFQAIQRERLRFTNSIFNNNPLLATLPRSEVITVETDNFNEAAFECLGIPCGFFIEENLTRTSQPYRCAIYFTFDMRSEDNDSYYLLARWNLRREKNSSDAGEVGDADEVVLKATEFWYDQGVSWGFSYVDLRKWMHKYPQRGSGSEVEEVNYQPKRFIFELEIKQLFKTESEFAAFQKQTIYEPLKALLDAPPKSEDLLIPYDSNTGSFIEEEKELEIVIGENPTVPIQTEPFTVLHIPFCMEYFPNGVHPDNIMLNMVRFELNHSLSEASFRLNGLVELYGHNGKGYSYCRSQPLKSCVCFNDFDYVDYGKRVWKIKLKVKIRNVKLLKKRNENE